MKHHPVVVHVALLAFLCATVCNCASAIRDGELATIALERTKVPLAEGVTLLSEGTSHCTLIGTLALSKNGLQMREIAVPPELTLRFASRSVRTRFGNVLSGLPADALKDLTESCRRISALERSSAATSLQEVKLWLDDGGFGDWWRDVGGPTLRLPYTTTMVALVSSEEGGHSTLALVLEPTGIKGVATLVPASWFWDDRGSSDRDRSAREFVSRGVDLDRISYLAEEARLLYALCGLQSRLPSHERDALDLWSGGVPFRDVSTSGVGTTTHCD